MGGKCAPAAILSARAAWGAGYSATRVKPALWMERNFDNSDVIRRHDLRTRRKIALSDKPALDRFLAAGSRDLRWLPVFGGGSANGRRLRRRSNHVSRCDLVSRDLYL